MQARIRERLDPHHEAAAPAFCLHQPPQRKNRPGGWRDRVGAWGLPLLAWRWVRRLGIAAFSAVVATREGEGAPRLTPVLL